MKWINYSKYTGDDFGLSAEDLLKALSDFFLQSGFQNQYMGFSEWNQHTLEDLKNAIQRALEQGELFDPSQAERIQESLQNMSPEQMDQMLDRLVQKLVDEGYINTDQQQANEAGQAGAGNKDQKLNVEITDKSVDFLGFKTLKDLLGSLGKSSFGAHDTRDLSTGVETSGAAKLYEFGDTFNLDISQTLSSAIQREGLKIPIQLEYSDLHVHQSEYQSSCATVLMLDCSHSMILYGEDRFTPAKKVALALAHLIRTQYPGDSLRCVLFHDSAEELRMSDLARVREERHEADHHDHRRQTIGVDARRWPHVPQRVRTRSAGDQPHARRSQPLQEAGHPDQYLHAGQRFRPGELRSKSHRTVPWESLLHHALQSRPISADGLHEPQDPHGTLARIKELGIAGHGKRGSFYCHAVSLLAA